MRSYAKANEQIKAGKNGEHGAGLDGAFFLGAYGMEPADEQEI
jgi:hypothetical protein